MVNFNPSLPYPPAVLAEEVKSLPLSISEIRSAYEDLHFSTLDIIFAQEMTSFDPKIDRFDNIALFKKSLVKLKAMPPEEYCFNANQIDISEERSLIATQYPFKALGQYYFWLTCLEKSAYIVDLTSEEERRKNHMQCYYPTSVGEKKSFQELTIRCEAEESLDTVPQCQIWTYQIFFKEEPCKQVKRVHFQNWPDHQASGLDDVIPLIHYLQTLEVEERQMPLIHCRAGVGRTGTLSTILAIAQLAKEQTLTSENLLPQLNALILKGRSQRSPYFVQQLSQYRMLVRLWEKIVADPDCLK